MLKIRSLRFVIIAYLSTSIIFKNYAIHFVKKKKNYAIHRHITENEKKSICLVQKVTRRRPFHDYGILQALVRA